MMVEARRFVAMMLFVCLSLVMGGPGALAQEKTELQEAASSSAAESSVSQPSEPAPQESAAPVSATEGSRAVSETAYAPAAAEPPAASLPETASGVEKPSEGAVEEKPSEWVWGEVVSVDETQKHVIIKHLDYETYEEAQMTIVVDDKTLYENVSALSEIKAGDHVTVDYKAKEGAGSVAGLIVVEKKEMSPVDAAAAREEDKAQTSSVVPAAESGTPAPPLRLGVVGETAVPAPEALLPSSSVPEAVSEPVSQEQPQGVAEAVVAPAVLPQTQASPVEIKDSAEMAREEGHVHPR